MRFLMLMYPGPKIDQQVAEMMKTGKVDPAMTASMEAMGRYNDELIKAGVLLAAEGLRPSAEAARVRFQGGKPKVTDGPFTETKEIIGGFWMLEVKSREEALEWARRVPASPEEFVELRQVVELTDFPADLVSPETAAKEQAFRDASAVASKH